MVIAELRHRISWLVQILVDSDPAAGCAVPGRDLDGELLRLKGRGVLTTLVEVARSRRITQIVLGQSRATSLGGLLRRPLSEQLQRQLRGPGIDLHLIGESADEPAAEPATELLR